MLGFGWQELLIVLVIVMVIFGAGKLTQVGSAIGQGGKEFKAEASGEEPDPAIAETNGKDEGRALGSRQIQAERI